MNKTKIERKLRRKTDQELVDTIIHAKKNSKWLKVGHLISTPRRKQSDINLNEIDKIAKDNETIIIPGKVLGNGEVSKKIRIVALYFSASALEKLKKSKVESTNILEEIKKNPEAKNIRIITNKDVK